MKTILQKSSLFILSIILAVSLLPARVYAGFEMCGVCQVQTDTGAAGTVKFLDYSYVNNTYLSLRDLAMVLMDTDKAFSVEISNSSVSLSTGGSYTPVGTENGSWESEENPDLSLRRNEFEVDGQKVFYHTMIMKMPSGDYDCFMMTMDLAMLFDMDIASSGTGSLLINTQDAFRVFPDALEQAGYFYGVNGVFLGDAVTGEVYYQYQADVP